MKWPALNGVRCTLPVFLAVTLLIFLAVPAAAQKVALKQLPGNEVVITGGDGASAWQLTYGIRPANYQPKLFEASSDRAFVALGPWLRLIDTRTGRVLGRWRFPGLITGLRPATEGGERVGVDIGMSPYTGEKTRTLQFDPAAPLIPNWMLGSLIALTASQYEAAVLFNTSISGSSTWTGRTINPEATALRIEEMVRRDPFAPWLRIAWGKVLRDLQDPRADKVFDEAVRVTTTDFTELFAISRTLEHMGVLRAADTAYDRAYADFITRGHDARLMTTIIARLVLYSPVNPNTPVDDTRRAELIERIYLLAPTSEGTDRAWEKYARYLDDKGDPGTARVWFQRADQSRRESLLPMNSPLLIMHDAAALVTFSALLAVVVFTVALWFKYRPEQRLRAAETLRQRFWRRGFFNVQYWSRRERVMAGLLLFAAWYGSGVAVVYMGVMTRGATLPISVGSFSGPDHVVFFGNLAARPSRDLLIAIAHQQEGNVAEAERLYRTLPEFAESWNNLGVLLRQTNRGGEAENAFARARAIDPQLPEAVLNTGGEATSISTRMHARYATARPMIAMPRREHMLDAIAPQPWNSRFLQALLGPLATSVRTQLLLGEFLPTWVLAPATVLMVFLVAAVLLIVGRREVTQAPPKSYWLWEMMLPGLAPGWRVLGAPVLLAATTLLTGALWWAARGSPFVLTSSWTAGVTRVFALPSEASGVNDLNPNGAVVAAVGITILAGHLFVLRRARRV